MRFLFKLLYAGQRCAKAEKFNLVPVDCVPISGCYLFIYYVPVHDQKNLTKKSN